MKADSIVNSLLESDVDDVDDPESVIRDFAAKDKAVTFLIHKSGEHGVFAAEPFTREWIIYSNDKKLPGADPLSGDTRTFEGYTRPTEHGWVAYSKHRKGLPLGPYSTDQHAAFAVYTYNRTKRII